MLTPQEVSERAFPKASFGGYNMTQVDEFLDVLTEDYSALYSENAVLKSKMKVLVEKVEEYRSTEEAMRKALMTAQRMADDLVKEAEQKRDQILQEAAAEAQKKVDSIRQEAEAEQFRLAAAQKETAGYVAKVKALHAQAQAYLDQLDLVLVMSVEPGFGGQSFIPGSLEKIAQLRAMAREMGLETIIEVDGGISARNAGAVYGAGADVLVAGSSVFGAEDPQAEVVKMLNA